MLGLSDVSSGFDPIVWLVVVPRLRPASAQLTKTQRASRTEEAYPPSPNTVAGPVSVSKDSRLG
jgi:hypothetical protein